MQDKKNKNIGLAKEDKASNLSENLLLGEAYDSYEYVDLVGSGEYHWNNTGSLPGISGAESSVVVRDIHKVSRGQENENLNLMAEVSSPDSSSVLHSYSSVAEDVNFVIDHSFMAFDEVDNLAGASYEIRANEKEKEIGGLIYEETRGGDFLESAVDEPLPYFLEKHEGSNDVYKILKGSLYEGHNVEIWDYDYDNAKIDIADFIEEYGTSFEYSVHKEDSDVKLHLSSNENAGVDIIFKEADFGSGDLDNIIKNIILDSGNKG